MANNSKILTAEQELALRKPIDEYVGGIQKKIDALREDGTAKVLSYNNTIDAIKRDQRKASILPKSVKIFPKQKRWKQRTRLKSTS